MARAQGLSISRREFRKLLVESYGKPNEPGGEPWYGEGRFVQHLAPGLFYPVGFCGRGISRTSSEPIRTLIGITCPSCVLVAKRIAKRIEANNV